MTHRLRLLALALLLALTAAGVLGPTQVSTLTNPLFNNDIIVRLGRRDLQRRRERQSGCVRRDHGIWWPCLQLWWIQLLAGLWTVRARWRALTACVLLGCQPVPTQAPTDASVARSEAAPHPPAPPRLAEAPAWHETRTAGELQRAACTGPGGAWVCGPQVARPPKILAAGAQPIIPVGWTVPAWFFDGQNLSGNASDGNDCQTAATPCRTYGEISVHRWGTTSPTLAQPTTFTLLSDQLSTDGFIFVPNIIGAGAATINGTLIAQATATIGTFTPRNRAAGVPHAITALGQSGAFWTPFVGDLVQDTTAGAWFWIEKDKGGASAQITEPLASSMGLGFTAPAYVTIAAADNLMLSRPSKLNASLIGVGAIPGGFPTYQHVEFAGSPFLSASASFFNEVRVDVGFLAPAMRIIRNSFFASTATYSAGAILIGGALAFDLPSIGFGTTQNILDGDVLIDCANLHVNGNVVFGRAYVGGAMDTDFSHVLLEIGQADAPGLYYADSELWGPGSLPLHGGGTLFINGGAGSATSSLLLTGSITIDGLSSAWPWNGAGSVYGTPQAITPALIDSTGGMSNPQTGTRISKRP